MWASEQSERAWPAPSVAPRQQTTLEVPNPGWRSIPLKRPTSGTPLPPLAPGELVTVRTRNSVYRLIVLDPTGRSVLIQGGRHFPCSTEAELLDGSSVLDLLSSSVENGRSLRFAVGIRGFVTSSIVTIEREGPHVRAA